MGEFVRAASEAAAPLADYNLHRQSYSGFSTLLVNPDSGHHLVFNRLLSGDGEFAVVEALSVDSAWNVEDEAVHMPLADCRFAACFRHADGSSTTVDEVPL